MSKDKSKMLIWLLVDVMLLSAIVIIIAFVLGQAKSNSGAKPSPVPIVTKKPEPSDTVSSPSPAVTAGLEEHPTPDVTPETSPSPEVTPEASPTPEATPTPEPTPVPAFSANASVTATQLNVRKGPGTTYDKVFADGSNILLNTNERIQITEISGKWYHVKIERKGVIYEGYVYGTYVKPDADSGFEQIK